MILQILGRLIATLFLLAPVAAAITAFIDPLIAWTIFLMWICSAGSIIGVAFIVVSLAHIWQSE